MPPLGNGGADAGAGDALDAAATDDRRHGRAAGHDLTAAVQYRFGRMGAEAN